MHRLAISSRILTSAASAVAASTQPAAAAFISQHAGVMGYTQVRAMSAGSKRDNKNGMQDRRAGGVRLPAEDEDETGSGGSRYKSRKQMDREEFVQDRRAAAAAGEQGAAAQPEPGMTGPKIGHQYSEQEYVHGTEEERQFFDEFEQMERERLREGEQSWRERDLLKAGIKSTPQFRMDKADTLRKKDLPSSASKHNPVLVRTRSHLKDSNDQLPAGFNHFKVPPLSADEIDQKQKDLHATYWSKYAAWKEARPEEHARWLERLKKREMEQDYHWQQSQLAPKKRIEALKKQATQSFLPAEAHRAAFREALKTDSALADAVKQLGQEEVLRRWSAYQVFLEAEIAAETKERNTINTQKRRMKRDKALNAEDTIQTLNDPDLKLSVGQKKKLYHMMLGAKNRVQEAPFWTDPDPRFEGEHDWKMADAFIKPPLLPPLHLLKHFSARPELNNNFSSLHKFLHFERLRQTVHFLKEQRKVLTRERKRSAEFDASTFASELLKDTKEWPHILKEYPFLSDCFLAAIANMHRAPWAPSDQKDFVLAHHRNIVAVSKLLDVHFSRRNRNAAWILPFPNNPRKNPDDVLTPMTPAEVKRMEAEVLAGQMLQVMEEEQRSKSLPTPPAALPEASKVPITSTSSQ